MDRTPSPPRRVHTPPAPFQGDNYEPFSPRRSSRVAAQRDLHRHDEQSGPRMRRDVTPTTFSKRSAVRASHLALSPPSSPISPQQLHSPRSARRVHPEANHLDSDSDMAPSSSRKFLSTAEPSMLPTPSKTPRKRRINDISSTARILFPSRPTTIEEVIPTPRKSRKTKDLYTLESFAEQTEDDAGTIKVYTDSKERVPTPGGDDENPFLTRKGKSRAKPTPQKSRNATNAKTQQIEDAVSRDEGIIYIFRGRKVYRKFQDGPLDVEQEDLSADDMQLRRQIGAQASRPLTRSAIKPRVLFKAEIQERNRENGVYEDDEDDEDDGEAPTDIEVPIATPSRRKGKNIIQASTLEATPPPTVRKVKKQMPFDSWTRVKSAHSSSSSTRETKKRGGAPLERESEKKARTRL